MSTTTAPTYSIEQQIHSLSSLSNPAFGVTAYDTIADLQAFVAKIITLTLADTTIQGLIGTDWQVVWGPVVWAHNAAAVPAIADNTMVLFYSPSQNQFVAAIAGTNIDSTYGWLTEDFSVTANVLWQTVVGTGVIIPPAYTGAAISQGTSDGLAALLGMVDSSSNTMLAALTNFLASVPAGANLAVAGHSLGGALSPVLALYMANTQTASVQTWNAGGKVTTIGAWPTAGPTPGEVNFAAYYASVVASTPPSGQAGLTYTSKYNSIDVVPHAWQTSSLAQIPFIYEAGGITQPSGATPTETITGSLAVGASLNALNSSKIVFGKTIPINTYTQVQPWTELTGTFDTATDGAVTNKLQYIAFVVPSALVAYTPYFTNLVRFLAQAAFQHTVAYTGSATSAGLLNIGQFSAEYQIVKTNNPPGQTDVQLQRAALARAVGVDIFALDTAALENAARTSKERAV